MTYRDCRTGELINDNGERIEFRWDHGTARPVTVKCYDVIGGMDQKTNLPRKAARQFWSEMLASGFTVNV